jgi:2-oxoisovalerate dehydrogenase E1 component beta subunit
MTAPTTATVKREITYLEAIREALIEEMERDEHVFLIGEDIGEYGGAFGVTRGLLEKFGPQRVIDTPISESGFTGAAAGAAMMGFRPVVEFQFIDFISSAFNMILNMIGSNRYRWRQGVPIVFRGPSGGGVHAGPFHSQNPEMYFAHMPGIKVVQPATAEDAKGLLKAAIRDPDPVLFLEHKALYRRVKGVMPEGDHVVPIGKAAVRRAGRDLTIFTYGAMLYVALEAADVLAADGIEAEIVDLRTIYPLDTLAIVESVRRTNKAIVLHEDQRFGGLAGEICAVIMEESFEHLDAPVIRITAPDTPTPFAPVLENAFRPSRDLVVRTARKLHAY